MEENNQKPTQKSTLIILALIMLVNALSYGTIIPLLYPYASRFGIDAFSLSLLFASFSFSQFIATPIIGRLSDRYGRKPLLLFSLFGTGISLALFALAQNIPMLFLARILDGITGGNISVAQAMIADTTTGKQRAQGFGILGAVFGVGFLVGPAIGGLLSKIDLTAPFWFASTLAFFSTFAGLIILKETNTKQNEKIQKHEPLFNFKALFGALSKPVIGTVLLTTLIMSLAQNTFILGFQAFTVDILKLDATAVGLLFAMAGVITIIMNAFGVKFVLARFGSINKILTTSFLLSSIFAFLLAVSDKYLVFSTVLFFYISAQSLLGPLISSLVSKKTNPEDQGIVLGLNQSYVSLGQILGPVMAGLVSVYNIKWAFVMCGVLMFSAFWFLKFSKSSRDLVDL